MDVGVDQAGEQGVRAEVDQAGTGRGLGPVRQDGGDPAARDGHVGGALALRCDDPR